jgi:hypothetical protein
VFKINLQLHGGKGGDTYTTQPDPPTPQELRMQEVQAQFAEKTAPNAYALQQKGADMLWNNPGIVPVNYSQMGNTAVAGAQNLQRQAQDLGNGVIPQAFLDNQRKVINEQLQGTMGNAVNNLMSRGVLGDSSPTRGAFYDIGRGVESAVANNFNNNLSQQSQNIEQQRGLLSQPMELLNSAQNASIDIPNKLLAMSRGEMANTSNLWQNMAQQRIASRPDVVVQPDNGGLLGTIAQAAGAYYGACFIAGTMIATPDGDKPIENIKVGDKVNSVDGVQTVTFTQEPIISLDDYMTVIDGDKRATTTSTQLFVTPDGDKYPHELNHIPAEKELVYDLSTTGSNTYYANGFAVRGRE